LKFCEEEEALKTEAN